MKLLIAVLIVAFTNCTNNNQQALSSPTQDSSSEKSAITIATSEEENARTTEIICDTVYKNKGYKITLKLFDTTGLDEAVPNTLLSFSKLTNGRYRLLFTDSIFNKNQDAQFADFNNDNIKDILVQNISDVRSNLTYYLYLVDTGQDKLKRIKGFEEIKNPQYLPKYNLIDNYVMSGQIWTSFYKIQGDSVKDFGITIYDNQTEDGSYERDYKKAIKSILLKEKKH